MFTPITDSFALSWLVVVGGRCAMKRVDWWFTHVPFCYVGLESVPSWIKAKCNMVTLQFHYNLKLLVTEAEFRSLTIPYLF
eukprot:m.25699 g.25699  ORF g.25699 m.25699 type:complete len:81 (-) comp8750_c1_seq1:507-749(-)